MEDSADLRSLLTAAIPGIEIQSVPARSGQRVVYFCTFTPQAGYEGRLPAGQLVLKVARNSSAHEVAYILREIRVLQNLDCPYFPRLFESITLSEDPRTEVKLLERLFITLEERVMAEPLQSVLDRFRNPCATTRLLVELVTALKHLWDQKPSIIHRDLKPQNILIKSNNEVVVIDLGIIRFEGESGGTFTGAAHGPLTPGYCSPEQATNRKMSINYRSDFFCLGVIAYEILNGQHPFHPLTGVDYREILGRVRTYNPTPLVDSGKAPKSLSDLIQKLIAKEPINRYRTSAELLDALNALKKELCP